MRAMKPTLMFLACAAAIPAFAQNTSDSRCGMTNYDKMRNVFTIVHPTPGTVNQQCFITVVPKESWPGGMPDPTRSKFVEGNYEITVAGGGGGGGGGAEDVGGGGGGAGAIPTTVVRYLQPGIYRMTIGSGGQGGAANGPSGTVGAPTSLANANSGQTIAGYPGADSWNGTYPQVRQVASARQARGLHHDDNDDIGASGGRPLVTGQSAGGIGGLVGHEATGHDGARLIAVSYTGAPGRGGTDLDGHWYRHEVAGGGGGGASFGNGGDGSSAAEDGKFKTSATRGVLGAGGGGGAGGDDVATAGAAGGDGFIRIALKDPVPSAKVVQSAPTQAAPAEPVAPAPRLEAMPPTRPPRVDRN